MYIGRFLLIFSLKQQLASTYMASLWAMFSCPGWISMSFLAPPIFLVFFTTFIWVWAIWYFIFAFLEEKRELLINICSFLKPHIVKVGGGGPRIGPKTALMIVLHVGISNPEEFFTQPKISWLYGNLKVEFCLKTTKSRMRLEAIWKLFFWPLKAKLWAINGL